jgi:uncharacterized RDD family membrane protein YckC
MSYAGVWIRFVAAVADGIAFFLVGFFVGMLSALSSGTADNQYSAEGGFGGTRLLLWVVVGLLYNVLLETTTGGTLGKHLTGLRVVDESGDRITVVQSLLRNVLRIVDGFFFCLVGAVSIWSSPKRQRVGDRVASTFVVRADSLARRTPTPGSPGTLPTRPAAARATEASANATIWEEFRN